MTGLRRSELAHLIARDIHIKQKMVIVRKDKGGKDRTIPLLRSLGIDLSEYITDMNLTASVFGLTGRSITDKISTWSKKAGLKLHPHSFRHYFAEQLLERGVPLIVVSALDFKSGVTCLPEKESSYNVSLIRTKRGNK